MRLSAKERAAYVGAIGSGRLSIHALPLESLGSIAAGALPRTPPPYECLLCNRTNLRDWNAAMQHVASRHTQEYMRTVGDAEVAQAVHMPSCQSIGDVDSLFENALVRIVNATSIDEAVAIATDALLGRTESDDIVAASATDSKSIDNPVALTVL